MYKDGQPVRDNGVDVDVSAVGIGSCSIGCGARSGAPNVGHGHKDRAHDIIGVGEHADGYWGTVSNGCVVRDRSIRGG